MDWLTGVRGQVVALDTAPLIYFIEEHPTYLPLVSPFRSSLAPARSIMTELATDVPLLPALAIAREERRPVRIESPLAQNWARGDRG